MNLLEADVNSHLDHAEDLPFLYGTTGLRDAIGFMGGLAGMLKGHSKTKVFATSKWDGQPAVVMGINPENGKCFVSTKSLFNKDPKINYTNADIDKNHHEGLAPKLKLALAAAKKLGIKGIIQGDYMFDDDIRKVEVIDGEKYVTFQPNTIRYAIPFDSEAGERALKAKIGLVFHTEYHGGTIASLKASFGVKQKFHAPAGIFLLPADVTDVSGTATMTKAETDIVYGFLSDVGKLFRTLNTKELDSFKEGADNADLGMLILTYGNSTIRTGEGMAAPNEHFAGLMKWIDERYEREAGKLKTPEAQAKKVAAGKEVSERLNALKPTITTVFKIQLLLSQAKIILLRKFEKLEGMTKQFLKTEDGFRVTKPEGFVAVSHEKGNAVKIIDRLEFSRANFTIKKDWGK